MKLLFLLLLTSCGHLFYQPHKKIYITPERFKLAYEDLYFESSDKTKLNAWLVKASAPLKGTVIFFHGNAENISTHFLQGAWLTKHGYQVFIFDYRGYGNSEGESEREGIYHDAQAALHKAWEIHQKTPDSSRFIVFAQSLGGNIAVPAVHHVGIESKIDLLILDSTFASYQKIAFDKLTDNFITFLLSPLAFVLVNDKLAAEEDIPKLKTKKNLVLHGTADHIVPMKFGKKIFEALPEPKELKIFEGAKHIDAFAQEENRQWLVNYLDALAPH